MFGSKKRKQRKQERKEARKAEKRAKKEKKAENCWLYDYFYNNISSSDDHDR